MVKITNGIGNSRIFYTHYMQSISDLQPMLQLFSKIGADIQTLIINFDSKYNPKQPDIIKFKNSIEKYEVEIAYIIGKKLKNKLQDITGLQVVDEFDSIDEFKESLSPFEFENEEIMVFGCNETATQEILYLIESKTHQTSLEVNRSAIVHNLNHFRNKLKDGVKTLAMVKANGYGIGSVGLSYILEDAGIDYLGVAYTDEGVELRISGINKPVLVMNPDINSFDKLISYDLEPEIFNIEGLQQFIEKAREHNVKNYPVHLKFDTGMNRLGFSDYQADKVCEILKKTGAVGIKSVMSHLTSTDDPADDEFTQLQIDRYNTIVEKLSKACKHSFIRHLCNSRGVERFKDAHFDMVRIGIGLHGISSENPNPLYYSSTLKTKISQIRELTSNDTVGYNRKGKLKGKSKIATIAIGYADGLHRRFGNQKTYVLVNGKKAPIIGNVCMDMCMIDITGINAGEGDEVIIFGHYPDEEITIDKLASIAGTIQYEIITSISSRVKRIFCYD